MRLSKTTSWRYRAGTRKTKRHGLAKGPVTKPCFVIPCPPFKIYRLMGDREFWDDVDTFIEETK